jgi:TonB family protein
MLNPHIRHHSMSPRAAALVVLGVLCLGLPAGALRAAGQAPQPLRGIVYDPSGAVVPEVPLTLEDAQHQAWRSTTDANGRFEFPPVGAGRYALGASQPGFRAFRGTVELRQDHDWERAITLQVGEVRETIVVKESRLSSSTAPAGPAPVRVGGNIRPPRKLHHVRPVYPASMREAGLEGLVPIEAIIGREGLVQSVRVLTAAVHPDFAQAAMDAVRQWRFDPTLLNGKAVEVVMTVSIEFGLQD